jgi:hypothetical protein
MLLFAVQTLLLTWLLQQRSQLTAVTAQLLLSAAALSKISSKKLPAPPRSQHSTRQLQPLTLALLMLHLQTAQWSSQQEAAVRPLLKSHVQSVQQLRSLWVTPAQSQRQSQPPLLSLKQSAQRLCRRLRTSSSRDLSFMHLLALLTVSLSPQRLAWSLSSSRWRLLQRHQQQWQHSLTAAACRSRMPAAQTWPLMPSLT